MASLWQRLKQRFTEAPVDEAYLVALYKGMSYHQLRSLNPKDLTPLALRIWREEMTRRENRSSH